MTTNKQGFHTETWLLTQAEKETTAARQLPLWPSLAQGGEYDSLRRMRISAAARPANRRAPLSLPGLRGAGVTGWPLIPTRTSTPGAPMNAEQFNQIAEARIAHCRQTLLNKGKEYSRGDDRLHNFRSAAAIDAETPEQALWGMLKKHVVSVRDMISDVALGTLPDQSILDEKITDWINYGLLLEGLLRERIDPAMENGCLLESPQPYATPQAAASQGHTIADNACGNLCRRP